MKSAHRFFLLLQLTGMVLAWVGWIGFMYLDDEAPFGAPKWKYDLYQAFAAFYTNGVLAWAISLLVIRNRASALLGVLPALFLLPYLLRIEHFCY